jgi:hypothetical protein
MPTVHSKLTELNHIARATKGRFKVNKALTISGIVLGLLSQIMSALTILILPAILLVVGGVVHGLVFRKSREQRTALRQMALLRQAVEEQWAAQGFEGADLRKLRQSYDDRIRKMEYDSALQQRFQALCREAGLAGAGIMADQRLL